MRREYTRFVMSEQVVTITGWRDEYGHGDETYSDWIWSPARIVKIEVKKCTK